MKYLFFLSGENTEIAKTEVQNLLRAYLKSVEVESRGQIVVLETDGDFKKFDRLALTHEVCEFTGSCETRDLEEFFKEISVPKKRTCVRVKRIGGVKLNSHELEKKLGAILWRRGAEISVSKPEVVVKVYISDRAYIGHLLHSIDKKQFIERQPDLKPYFRPGVILPKLAKALVNISGVKEEEILLDPMCGAGTILIEAGLMGINFVGVEVFSSIIKGCARNLAYYNLPLNLVRGDVKKLPFKEGSIDSIVTDFPYLKSSKSYGKLEELYDCSLSEFERVLKQGNRAVVISNRDVDEALQELFVIEEKFYQKIHSSLTRRIYVCRKC